MALRRHVKSGSVSSTGSGGAAAAAGGSNDDAVGAVPVPAAAASLNPAMVWGGALASELLLGTSPIPVGAVAAARAAFTVGSSGAPAQPLQLQQQSVVVSPPGTPLPARSAGAVSAAAAAAAATAKRPLSADFSRRAPPVPASVAATANSANAAPARPSTLLLLDAAAPSIEISALARRVAALEAALAWPAAAGSKLVVASWDAARVLQWLAQQPPAVAALAPLFVRHGVVGRDLSDLSHADLLSMGVTVLGTRKAVLGAVAAAVAVLADGGSCEC